MTTTVRYSALGDRITNKLTREDRLGGAVLQEDITMETVQLQSFELEERKPRFTKQDRQKNWPERGK